MVTVAIIGFAALTVSMPTVGAHQIEPRFTEYWDNDQSVGFWVDSGISASTHDRARSALEEWTVAGEFEQEPLPYYFGSLAMNDEAVFDSPCTTPGGGGIGAIVKLQLNSFGAGVAGYKTECVYTNELKRMARAVIALDSGAGARQS